MGVASGAVLLIRQLNTRRSMGSCRINKLRAEARKNTKM
jgi:hypothetical protein